MIVSIDDFMYNGKIKDIKDGEAIDLRATVETCIKMLSTKFIKITS